MYRREINEHALLVDFHTLAHAVVAALEEVGVDVAPAGQIIGHQDDQDRKRFVHTDRDKYF